LDVSRKEWVSRVDRPRAASSVGKAALGTPISRLAGF
jgi:hypothetical protein